MDPISAVELHAQVAISPIPIREDYRLADSLGADVFVHASGSEGLVMNPDAEEVGESNFEKLRGHRR